MGFMLARMRRDMMIASQREEEAAAVETPTKVMTLAEEAALRRRERLEEVQQLRFEETKTFLLDRIWMRQQVDELMIHL